MTNTNTARRQLPRQVPPSEHGPSAAVLLLWITLILYALAASPCTSRCYASVQGEQP